MHESITQKSNEYDKFRNHIRSNLHNVKNRNYRNNLQLNEINDVSLPYNNQITNIMDIIRKLYNENKTKFRVSNPENLEKFLHKLSDEILRNQRIKDYIFIDNRYILFDVRNDKSKENEIFVTQSSLDTISDDLSALNEQVVPSVFDTSIPDERTTYDNDGIEFHYRNTRNK